MNRTFAFVQQICSEPETRAAIEEIASRYPDLTDDDYNKVNAILVGGLSVLFDEMTRRRNRLQETVATLERKVKELEAERIEYEKEIL